MTRDTEDVSDTLLDDQRILNTQEKELLADLLQRTRLSAHSGEDLSAAVARAAGDIVAQRASAILASSVTRKLLGQTLTTFNDKGTVKPQAFPPLPPAPSPPSPGPRAAVNLHGETAAKPQTFPPLPPAPHPPSPSSPKAGMPGWDEPYLITNTEQAELVPAQCLTLENFLSLEELESLMRYTFSNEQAFESSEVVAPGSSGGMIDYEHRQSRVFRNPGTYPALMDRIQSRVPSLLASLGREPFSISHVEAQITASNDGDFFHWHNDNAHPETASREITFVYFFHREPKAFTGGELRIYDCRRVNGLCKPSENYRVIVPRQNQIVFFASSLAHEITPVLCPSRAFADSRFTVNGWLHRNERRLSATA